LEVFGSAASAVPTESRFLAALGITARKTTAIAETNAIEVEAMRTV
jgi:hypothetical protein